MSVFLVVHGVTWKGKGGKVRRAEPGTRVDDLPVKSVGWLLEQGDIEKVDD